MNRLMTLLRELGFAINYNKVVGPTTRLTFLGIEIDTVDFNLSLPPEKLRALQEELLATTSKRNISKSSLQSLCGKLNWAAQVVYGGRPHLRRLIDKINNLSLPHHRTRITAWMSADLNWWVRFMAVFNGCTPILNKRLNTSVCIDACTAGGGGYYDGDWYHVRWDQWEGTADLHINYKEVLALWPAAMLYGNMWHDRTVTVYSDNQAAVSIINRGSAKNPLVMDYLRDIFWVSAVNNFRLRAIYYPGRLNRLADAASRLTEKGGVRCLQAALETTFHSNYGFTGAGFTGC